MFENGRTRRSLSPFKKFFYDFTIYDPIRTKFGILVVRNALSLTV